MRKNARTTLAVAFVLGTLGLLLALFGFQVLAWQDYVSNLFFWLFVVSLVLVYSEIFNWVRNGKRSDMFDLVAIGFLFFTVYLFTGDLFNSLLGAFSIYLFFAIMELREYKVINKLALISLIVYNVIFFAGLVSEQARDVAFSMSFWLILILGFVFFGRKYIVVWRFMSPQYLTLGLYLIAWLGVTSVSEYTSVDLLPYIYLILILTEVLIYFISGPVLDKILGVKRSDDPELVAMVREVSRDLGIKRKVKVGFAAYPIINAMAYGSVFDPRICVIAEKLEDIDKDQLRGIVAHELAHVRGRHTLILTVITAVDLLVRWALGIPATYYDYAFTDPDIPLLGFILLNLGIFVVLYVFVRLLEARADLQVKRLGLGPNLARALYTLEGFYSSGREVGLNTMLLCDEKIKPYNKVQDYYETGRYVSSYLVKPSRLSVLANVLNSHPPSPIRIAAMYTDIKPAKEALYTFTLLRRKNTKAFGRTMASVVKQVERDLAGVFRDKFHIADIGAWNQAIRTRELYKLSLGKTFLFKAHLSEELLVGTITDMQFEDDFLRAILLQVEDREGNTRVLNPVQYKLTEIKIGGTYHLHGHEDFLTLQEVRLGESLAESQYLFTTPTGEEVEIPVKKARLPLALDEIEAMRGRPVFQKFQGTLKRFMLHEVTRAAGFAQTIFTFHKVPEDLEGAGPPGTEDTTGRGPQAPGEPVTPLEVAGADILIFPRDVFLPFHKDKQTRPRERAVVEYLIAEGLRTTIYLKKPINNAEEGTITGMDPVADQLSFENVFGESLAFPWKTIEGLHFADNTFTFQTKHDASFATVLGNKLLRRVSPKKIIMR